MPQSGTLPPGPSTPEKRAEDRDRLRSEALLARTERFQSFEASYQENGTWIVTGDWCIFVVDDGTGKVTGP